MFGKGTYQIPFFVVASIIHTVFMLWNFTHKHAFHSVAVIIMLVPIRFRDIAHQHILVTGVVVLMLFDPARRDSLQSYRWQDQSICCHKHDNSREG